MWWIVVRLHALGCGWSLCISRVQFFDLMTYELVRDYIVVMVNC